MRFSQRIGKTSAVKLAQRESIDNDLRNSLWSILSVFYWDTFLGPGDGYTGRVSTVRGSNLELVVFKLWLYYFKRPTDTVERQWDACLKRLRDYFFKAQWFEVYDFVEFVAHAGPKEQLDEFIVSSNVHLAAENSAYRFVAGMITEITSEQEIEEVERAQSTASPYAGVQAHLVAALTLMADRKSPDYRNSIKESISAVEALARRISGENTATLGAVLRQLEKTKKLHPALKSAFSSLYGYTSDADGIRHALLEESNLVKADARFMLVCCSAFINYTVELVAESDA